MQQRKELPTEETIELEGFFYKNNLIKNKIVRIPKVKHNVA